MTPSNKSSLIRFGLLAALLFAPRVYATVPSLLFSPAELNIVTDSQFKVDILLNTAGQGVSGAGVKVVFDPYYLSATSISIGSIFADYPAAIIDNDKGLITISGIVSSPTDLYTGTDTFASITFHPSHAGETKVKYNYVPGSTTDSNIAVMTGNGDILGEVNELTISISGESVETPTPTSTPNPTITPITIIKSITAKLGLSSAESAVERPGREMGISDTAPDPLAPIVRQPPITDPSSTQPIADANYDSNPLIIILIIIGLLILLLLIVIIVLFTRRSHPTESTPLQPPTNSLY